MHFSIAITLGLYYLLCQKVSSSKYSILDNHHSTIDQANNILREFFAEFTKALSSHKGEYRHVTIIGASLDKLRHMQSVLENYPYTIHTNPETFVHPKKLNAAGIYIIFQEDLNDEMIDKDFKISLPWCSEVGKIIFIIEGVEIASEDIESIGSRIWKQSMRYSEFLHLDKNDIKFYRAVTRENCIVVAKLLFAWTPGTGISKINSLFVHEKFNMQGCPVIVGTILSEIRMIIREDQNGSRTIIGGQEGNLVLLLAEAMNFTIVVKYPTHTKYRNESLKDILVHDVADGIVDLAIARLRPSELQEKNTESSKSYGYECLTWAIPRGTSLTDNLVWAEFPGQVWAMIAAVFAVACFTEYAFENINFRKNRNQRRVGFAAGVLDILAMSLGKPLIYIPISNSSKLLLIFHLYYSTVLITAYDTSLATILTTGRRSPTISDVEGIIKANLKIGGSSYNLIVYKNQNNASEIDRKVIERFECIDDASELMDRLNSDSNFACLARRSILNWGKQRIVFARKSLTFDVFDDCVLSYSSIIVFRKGLRISKPINDVVWKATEFGLLSHWENTDEVDNRILKRSHSRRPNAERINQKFKNIFIFHTYCLFSCLLVFFIEIIVAKLRVSLKKTHSQP